MLEQAVFSGMAPDAFWELSLREWTVFQRGHRMKQEAAWQHTSSLLSFQANLNIPKGRKTTSPEDFNPYTERFEENAGINSKEDVMELVKKLR